MFSKIEEGVERYKEMCREYGQASEQLRWSVRPVHMRPEKTNRVLEHVRHLQYKLRGAADALGLTVGERDRIAKECGINVRI
jgi:hypothetical protein